MKTCKDCVHLDVCEATYADLMHAGGSTFMDDSENVDKDCRFFKDNTKLIELPFCKDGYCIFGKGLYRVFGVTANGDNDFYVNIYNCDNVDDTFTSIPSRAVVFISDQEARKKWEELNAQ